MALLDVEQQGKVGVIRLNDPATLNAIGPTMLDEIAEAVDRLEGTSRTLVISSHGRAFSSGANLAAFSGLMETGASDAGAFLESHVNPLMRRLSGLGIPWIAAVRGAAAGVGCSLALAADLVIAAQSAYFMQAFVRVGLVPDGGASWLLARAVGRVRAMEMMLLGERVPAEQALDWGMINRVVPDEAVDRTALELAAMLAAGPSDAIRLLRRLAWSAAESSWHDALAAERAAQRIAGRSDDIREGLRAFQEKRAPRFS